MSSVVGSNVRRQYAVIGSSVNLGARLCAQATAGEVVLSQATFDGLPAPPPEYTEYTTQLKGIDGTPTLYRTGTRRTPRITVGRAAVRAFDRPEGTNMSISP